MGELGDLLKFGTVFKLGLTIGILLVSEALFIVSDDDGRFEWCGRNNNLLGSLLGLDRLLPPISSKTRAVMLVSIDAFCFVLGFLLIRKVRKRLRFLVRRSRQIWFHFAMTGRVLAWVCVLSALLLLIKNTSSCFGVMAISCLTTCLVGAVNIVADPEDVIAFSRWVFEQSIVLAFLVALRQGKGLASSFNVPAFLVAVREGRRGVASTFIVPAALFPVVPALWAILARKITAQMVANALQLPTSTFDIPRCDEKSQYLLILDPDEYETSDSEDDYDLFRDY